METTDIVIASTVFLLPQAVRAFKELQAFQDLVAISNNGTISAPALLEPQISRDRVRRCIDTGTRPLLPAALMSIRLENC